MKIKAKGKTQKSVLICLCSIALLSNSILPNVSAQDLTLKAIGMPKLGDMVLLSEGFEPPLLKGMRIDPDHLLKFDFILDSGSLNLSKNEIRQESEKLIKYFLASLAMPEDDLWVNLSPYERNKIIPDKFGQTEMGRDLLAQDYILKQLTASLIYPEEDLGKEFWNRVYAKARKLYGTDNIPVKTFNKVWVVPEKAVVYTEDNTVYVVESYLKVMLEEDYLATNKNLDNRGIKQNQLQEQDIKKLSNLSSQIMKEVIIPEIEKEVNYGKHFSKLRQVYHSLILAKWYKENLKESILNREYSDQRKILGVDVEDKEIKEKIYVQYLEAFKAETRQRTPRKYFSGGFSLKFDMQHAKSFDLASLSSNGTDLYDISGVYGYPRSQSSPVKADESSDQEKDITQLNNISSEEFQLTATFHEMIDTIIGKLNSTVDSQRLDAIENLDNLLSQDILDKKFIKDNLIFEKLLDIVRRDRYSDIRYAALSAYVKNLPDGYALSEEDLNDILKKNKAYLYQETWSGYHDELLFEDDMFQLLKSTNIFTTNATFPISDKEAVSRLLNMIPRDIGKGYDSHYVNSIYIYKDNVCSK